MAKILNDLADLKHQVAMLTQQQGQMISLLLQTCIEHGWIKVERKGDEYTYSIIPLPKPQPTS
jgi:hypothetical protein